MRNSMLPFYEFRRGIYEIDEFACVSMFLIVGEKKALMIDAGVGVGDVRPVIGRITDKPVIHVASHNHMDHIGGSYIFESMYMHEDDIDAGRIKEASDYESRKDYARMITKREGKWFPYNVETDIEEWPRTAEFIPIQDGHVFDLGGRTITAYHVPGHTKGELVFLDNLTHTLIVGDAVNCNWYLDVTIAATPHEALVTSYNALKRIEEMHSEYDYVINSHHDYRGYGNPLNPDVLPNLTENLRRLINGTAEFRTVKDPMATDGGTRVVAANGDSEVAVFAPLSIEKL